MKYLNSKKNTPIRFLLLLLVGVVISGISYAQAPRGSGLIQLRNAYNQLKKPEVSFQRFAEINSHVFSVQTAVEKSAVASRLAPQDTYCSKVRPYCTGGDFENGLDENQYTGAYGFYTASSVYPDPFSLTYGFSSGPLNSGSAHQTIVDTTSGTDPITGIPLAPPNGGAKSLRLGNTVNGYGTELIAKTLVVDPNETILNFYYAVVFEDPGHPFSQQPAFSVRAYDCATGLELPNVVDLGNGSNVAVSDAQNPFFQSLNFGQIAYRDWSKAQVNLSAHVGKTVIIIFTTKDCGQGGHWGYGYIDNLFSSQCPPPGEATTGQGSVMLDRVNTDTCGVGQVCTKYSLPFVDSAGTTTTGSVTLTMYIYQNNVLVDSIVSPTLTADSSYCFNVNPANLNLDNNLGGFDYSITGRFMLSGFALSPIIVGNPPIGVMAGVNNDYMNSCGDTTGCTAPTFLNNQQIVLDASCGMNDGNISIIPLSGAAPFMYSIDGGTTYVAGPDAGWTFQGLAAGTYHLRLKDANGCESNAVEREVKSIYGCGPVCTAPTFLNNLQIVLDATCGMNDGNISIIPTSGTGPFMYSIDGGATYVAGPDAGFTFTGLAAGTYQLRLKSGDGCESAVVNRAVDSGCPPSTTAPATTSAPVIDGAAALDVVELPLSADRKEVISTYPNPSRGQFRVQLQNFASPKAEVSVFDGKGTLIQKNQLNLTESNTVNFDLSRRAPGLYYIKIVSKNGTKLSRILIQ